MAEDTDSGSKTEEASPRKLEQAKQNGDVAKSQDVSGVASLAAVVAVILMAGGWLATNLATQLQPFIAHPDSYDLANGGAVLLMQRCWARRPWPGSAAM
jgi:flagellar biosynthetic protein FlhB